MFIFTRIQLWYKLNKAMLFHYEGEHMGLPSL
jgi:hypothetical protein